MFHMGDFGDKYKIGMQKSDVLNGAGAMQSTYWGVRWLYFKSMSSPDGKTKNFNGWENAIHKYGPGVREPNYKDKVMQIYKSVH